MKSIYQLGRGTVAEEGSFIRCLEEESEEEKVWLLSHVTGWVYFRVDFYAAWRMIKERSSG